MSLQLNRRQLLEAVAALGLAGALPVVDDFNDDGPTPANLGSTYTVTDYDTGRPLMDFTVHVITPTACPHADFPHQPENGRFLAVALTAATLPDPQDLLEFVYPAFPWYSRTIDGDVLASTAEAFACYDGPFKVEPNTRYDIALILDVPADVQSLIYHGLPGWEWQL